VTEISFLEAVTVLL